MERIHLQELTFPKRVNKSSIFYGNGRFVTACTRSGHISLSWNRRMQATPSDLLSLISIFLISSHLRPGPLSGLLFLIPTENFHVFTFSPVCSTCLTHLIFIDFIVLITPKRQNLCSSSLHNSLLPVPQHPFPEHPKGMFFP